METNARKWNDLRPQQCLTSTIIDHSFWPAFYLPESDPSHNSEHMSQVHENNYQTTRQVEMQTAHVNMTKISIAFPHMEKAFSSG